MPVGAPNFYPFAQLRRYSRAEASRVSELARWFTRPSTSRALAALLGADCTLRLEGTSTSLDPNAAIACVRAHGESIFVFAPSQFIRDVAQRLLKGPDELAAPRPLTAAEQGVWAVLVSAALTDAGLPGEVWPAEDGASPTIELSATVGARVVPIHLAVPASIATRVPPTRWPRWTFDLPIVVGACSLPADVIANLRVRDVVTLERRLALHLGDGAIDLTAPAAAVDAEVTSGYYRRAMTTSSAELELTVQLGTTRMSLQKLSELSPGAVVSLGRPLSGPFEVRAAGRLIGQGELVDVDGELGVRIVSLQE